MSWTSQWSRSVTKTTLSDLLPPTNTDTTTEQEKLSPVQMPQLPACYNALTCRACHWQLLITSRWGDSLWSAANLRTPRVAHTHTHTYTLSLAHTNKPNQMCLCANTNVHTQAQCARICIQRTHTYTHAHRCVSHCTSLPHVRGKLREEKKKKTPKSPHQDLDCDKTCAQIRWNLSGNNNMTAGSEAPNIKCHIYFQPWLRAVWQTIPCCFSISQPVSWKCGKLGPWMSFPFRKNKKWSEVEVKVKGEIIKLRHNLSITFNDLSNQYCLSSAPR